MGSGLHGVIEGRRVSAGSRDMIFARRARYRMGVAGDTARLVAIGAHRLRRRRGTTDRRAAARRRTAFRHAARHPACCARRALPASSWSPATAPPPRRRSAPRSISMPCWPTAFPPTRSTPCAPSSGSIRPSWSATASTTPRRWHRPTSAIALGARGASASSEAADVVILADRLDRVGEAIMIAQRARRIAVESIVAGMGLSVLAMLAATFGWLAAGAGGDRCRK